MFLFTLKAKKNPGRPSICFLHHWFGRWEQLINVLFPLSDWFAAPPGNRFWSNSSLMDFTIIHGNIYSYQRPNFSFLNWSRFLPQSTSCNAQEHLVCFNHPQCPTLVVGKCVITAAQNNEAKKVDRHRETGGKQRESKMGAINKALKETKCILARAGGRKPEPTPERCFLAQQKLITLFYLELK